MSLPIRKNRENIEIQFPYKYIDPDSGEAIPQAEAFRNRFANKGFNRYFSGEDIFLRGDEITAVEYLWLTNDTNLPISTVRGFRGYLRITEAQLSEVTPDYMPDRTIHHWDNTDPENPIPLPDTYKTWDEWVGENFTKTLYQGNVYFPANAYGLGRDDLSEFTYQSLDADGYTFYSFWEWIAWAEINLPQEPI